MEIIKKSKIWVQGLFVVMGIFLFFSYEQVGRTTVGSLIFLEMLLFAAGYGIGYGKDWKSMTKKEKFLKVIFGALFLAVATIEFYYADRI
jgi:hypothetical protein